MFVILKVLIILFHLYSFLIAFVIPIISFDFSFISNMPQNILPKFANMPMHPFLTKYLLNQISRN